jgi:Uma2 family endonuclease
MLQTTAARDMDGAMSVAARQRMTADEFILWNLEQEARYELVDGFPVLKFDNGPEMMAGASDQHDQIVVNLIQALRVLRGSPCRVKSADQAARMASGDIRYPDVTIDCGARRPDSYESVQPTVFFEVLSPSTRRFDLIRKTNEYQALPSLRHFVLLEPDRPAALLWTREEDGGWTCDEITGLERDLPLPAVGVVLTMAEVYEDVEFSPGRLRRP